MAKILTYHKAGVRFDSSLCWVDNYRFRQDIHYLQSLGFSLETLSQVVEDDKERGVAVTFDDGFAATARYLDLFGQHDIKVTIFNIVDYIGDFDRWDVSLLGMKFKHLNRQQIREFSEQGHEIGSHGKSHRPLTLLDDSTLALELDYSKKVLEDITGRECISISVPFGRIDKRVYDFCLKAGYRHIVSIGKKKFSAAHLHRGKSVYLGDPEWLISAKLGLNRLQVWEELRLDVINKFSGGTILVKELLGAKMPC